MDNWACQCTLLSWCPDRKKLHTLSHICRIWFKGKVLNSRLGVIWRPQFLSPELRTFFIYSDNVKDRPLFFTIIKGKTDRISPDNVGRIINKYTSIIGSEHLNLPGKIYPRMFRRTRACNLYQCIFQPVSAPLSGPMKTEAPNNRKPLRNNHISDLSCKACSAPLMRQGLDRPPQICRWSIKRF